MSNIFRLIQTSVANWHRRKTTIRALSTLNDHLLKDIGIDRSEIASVAAELTGQAEPSRVHTVVAANPANQNGRPAATSPANSELPKAA